ncbi:MAG: hypothetical protein ACRBBM_17435 [Pseudomonadaceae bacterium]
MDAPIVFIHPADSAWDKDAVAASEKEHGKDCPFLRYHSGDTRFDASEVQALLKGRPIEFHLSRLSALQLNEVQSLIERDHVQSAYMYRTAYWLAERYGLIAIKQGGDTLIELRSPGNLTIADNELLVESFDIGIDLIRHIGQAVYLASQPLRDDEKKL